MIVIKSAPTLVIPSDDWVAASTFAPSKQLMREIERTYPKIGVLWHEDSHFASYDVYGRDEFRVPDEDELESLERDYPWVTDTWGLTHLDQFQASFCLMSICRKGKKASQFESTYSVKHDVENVSGIYISEGALALAAQFAGFTAVPAHDGGWKINLLVDEMHCCMLHVLKRAKNAITSRERALVEAL